MTDSGIKAYLVGGWSTLSLPDQSLLLQVHLAPDPMAPQTGRREALNFAITAAQARGLAKTLLDAATATEMGPAPTPSRN
jgi:hypothetical protein